MVSTAANRCRGFRQYPAPLATSAPRLVHSNPSFERSMKCGLIARAACGFGLIAAVSIAAGWWVFDAAQSSGALSVLALGQ